jgi:hypothetical protein
MVTTVPGKREFKDLNELLQNLDRLRQSGGEIHNVSKSDRPGQDDHFFVTYSNTEGRFVGEFTLPPQDANYLSEAIRTGFFGAQALNAGTIGEVLLNFAASAVGRFEPSAPLKIGGVGTNG